MNILQNLLLSVFVLACLQGKKDASVITATRFWFFFFLLRPLQEKEGEPCTRIQSLEEYLAHLSGQAAK